MKVVCVRGGHTDSQLLCEGWHVFLLVFLIFKVFKSKIFSYFTVRVLLQLIFRIAYCLKIGANYYATTKENNMSISRLYMLI